MRIWSTLNLKTSPILSRLLFLIGPEGAFLEKEISYLSNSKIKAVSLGSQRLRTETAGIFRCSLELQSDDLETTIFIFLIMGHG
ncbi:16S rRNA (uracil(1498)-N(3))-methyltransferase [Exiguobacterium sp. SL14]|nr:16S rRNA (uracil(1498)-N(3))-methyltransferase [Exiguobacterium sp. SL14]